MSNTLYAIVPEFRAQYDGAADSVWDNPIQLALDAAAAAIDGYCNQGVPFVASETATARQFAGSDNRVLWIAKFVAVTLAEYRYSPSDTWKTVTAGAYIPFSGDRASPNFDDLPYNSLMLTGASIATWPRYELDKTAFPTARITARWGYGLEVPPSVKQATLAQATIWFTRGKGAWANALASGELGQIIFPKRVDPDIARMLDDARLVRPSI